MASRKRPGRAPGRLLLALFLLGATGGCAVRTALYAPRMPDSREHREAVRLNTCRDCHDPAKVRSHKPTDDCASCHRICTGC